MNNTEIIVVGEILISMLTALSINDWLITLLVLTTIILPIIVIAAINNQGK